jgi:hypothetical protein
MKRSVLLFVIFTVSVSWAVISGMYVIVLKKNAEKSPVSTTETTQEPTNVKETPRSKKDGKPKWKVIEGTMPVKKIRKPLVDIEKRIYSSHNGVPHDEDDTIYTNTVDHGDWKQIYVNLPPFRWETPRLLNNKAWEWFWQQNENFRHFEDTINSYSGCVRVIKNGRFGGSFAGGNNQSHYTNIRGDPEFTDNPEYDIAFYLTGHQSEFFQHFFDNGLPHISLMLLATGYHPKDVTMVVSGWLTDSIPKVLQRWGFKEVIQRGGASAKTLVLPEIVPVIHNKFYELYVHGMKFNYSDANKIVFVSRMSGDTGKNDRLIMNQDQVINAMKRVYGEDVVLYRPKEHSFNSSVELFQKAKVVIGAHGGAMYNAMYASPDAKIIEIMPIKSDGFYSLQFSSTDIPQFAHMAMYTNAQLMGQPFYRYYQVSSSSNMNIDVGDYMKFLTDVLNDKV